MLSAETIEQLLSAATVRADWYRARNRALPHPLRRALIETTRALRSIRASEEARLAEEQRATEDAARQLDIEDLIGGDHQ